MASSSPFSLASYLADLKAQQQSGDEDNEPDWLNEESEEDAPKTMENDGDAFVGLATPIKATSQAVPDSKLGTPAKRAADATSTPASKRKKSAGTGLGSAAGPVKLSVPASITFNKILVEVPFLGEQSVDLSGDVGAVGRILMNAPDLSEAGAQLPPSAPTRACTGAGAEALRHAEVAPITLKQNGPTQAQSSDRDINGAAGAAADTAVVAHACQRSASEGGQRRAGGQQHSQAEKSDSDMLSTEDADNEEGRGPGRDEGGFMVDLKGVMFAAQLVEMPCTALVVNISDKDAKVENVFNEFVQLKKSSVFAEFEERAGDADWMLSGPGEQVQEQGSGEGPSKRTFKNKAPMIASGRVVKGTKGKRAKKTTGKSAGKRK